MAGNILNIFACDAARVHYYIATSSQKRTTPSFGRSETQSTCSMATLFWWLEEEGLISLRFCVASTFETCSKDAELIGNVMETRLTSYFLYVDRNRSKTALQRRARLSECARMILVASEDLFLYWTAVVSFSKFHLWLRLSFNCWAC